MHAESLAKAYVLTHGVRFTEEALGFAAQVNAKRQNGVYNLPAADTATPAIRRGNLALSILPSEARLDRPHRRVPPTLASLAARLICLARLSLDTYLGTQVLGNTVRTMIVGLVRLRPKTDFMD